MNWWPLMWKHEHDRLMQEQFDEHEGAWRARVYRLGQWLQINHSTVWHHARELSLL